MLNWIISTAIDPPILLRQWLWRWFSLHVTSNDEGQARHTSNETAMHLRSLAPRSYLFVIVGAGRWEGKGTATSAGHGESAGRCECTGPAASYCPAMFAAVPIKMHNLACVSLAVMQASEP